MAIPPSRFDPNGKLIPYNPAEVASFDLRTRNIRDGRHPTRTYSPNANRVDGTAYFADPRFEDEVICYLLGAVAVAYDPATQRNRLSRLMPTTFPGTDRTIAATATTRGFQFVEDAPVPAAVPVPTYTEAEVDVQYVQNPFNLGTDEQIASELDRYVEAVADEPLSEYLTLRGGGLTLIPRPGQPGPVANTPVPYNVGLPFVSSRFRRKWWRLPKEAVDETSVLYARIHGSPEDGEQPYLGTVNKTAIFGRPAGTLLLEGAEKEPSYDPVTEDRCFNLTYVWRYVPNGANYLYWPGSAEEVPAYSKKGWYFAGIGNTWFPAETLPDGVAIYNAREHRDLFDVG